MNPIIAPESNSHWYSADGVPQHGATLREARKQNLYPSVTTVIRVLARPQLERWKIENAILASLTLPRASGEPEQAFAKRVANDFQNISGAAADFGKRVHDACEAYNLFKKVVEDPVLIPYVDKYVDWFKENVKEVLKAETVVLDKTYGYAGRIDLLFRHHNAKVYIADIKTQKYDKKPQTYESWGMQLAAYAACEESLGCKPDGMMSLIMKSNEPAKVVVEEWENQTEFYIHFIKALEIWQWQKKYKPKRD